MTSQEKHIYNSFLRISRTKQNNPYRIRKNFEGFEDDKNYIYIRKLSNILERNKSINLDDFLIAPYEVYNDGSYYDLKFYCSQRAIKVYTTYLKKRLESIDSDEMISKIKDSLFFIYKFCKENKIPLSHYPKHMTNIMNSFVLHIQENDVAIYTLFGFEHFEKELTKIPYDVRQFILGEQLSDVDELRRRYYTSTKAKSIICKGIEHLNAITKKSLNFPK